MATCHRAPPFPLSAANPLMEEAKTALAQPLLSPEALDSLYSTMASLRREIHANPEPGFEETKTNALLRSILMTLAGIPESAFSDCAGTGLVVDMMGEGDFLAPAGAASVRTIALRADMDALRMTEGNNVLPYRSANEGVAHLCGHDGHMASLVGAAALLRRRLSRVPCDCKVRLLFQPAEEGPGGAAPMVEGGCMQGVDEVYGYHNWPSWPLGHLKVAPGPVMAHPSSFEIVISGKGGHGSQPQFAVDPVLVSAHVIVALQSVVSRSVPSSEQAGPPARNLALTLAPTLALIPDLSRSRSQSRSQSQGRGRSRSQNRRCSVLPSHACLCPGPLDHAPRARRCSP
jgi:metal-dependent amidase/aminoacylase/carboxypeptidase family protein